MRYIGKEMSRVDGIAKVTGQAKYAAEIEVPNLSYGYLAICSIGKGAIEKLDTKAAEASPGVLKVYTHLNVPGLLEGGEKETDNEFHALRSPEILFSGQPVALVVAETFEQARAAARLIQATYKTQPPQTDLRALLDKAYKVPNDRTAPPRGKPEEAYAAAPVKIEAEYFIPAEHHHPIEPHGATAYWTDNKLTIIDKSQNVYQVRDRLSKLFGIPVENVTALALFVGGAFGSSLNLNYYPPLAALAARDLKRPVRLSYSRYQMNTGHGYRPVTWQKMAISAEKDGKLTSISQDVVVNSSSWDNYSESFVPVARVLYACPNVAMSFKTVKTDLPTPMAMRAPGAVSNMFALECALDELSYALKLDPLELRLINYAEKDPETGKPFSSKALRECYRMGAEKFGWNRRNPTPRSMRDGRLLVGWGTATGIWPAMQMAASARINLLADGTAQVSSSVTDIGPGTYTVMTIIAAEHLGLPAEKVKVQLGDSRLPKAPAQGGSWSTASVGSAILGAAQNLQKKLLELAAKDPARGFQGLSADDVELAGGALRSKKDVKRSVTIAALLQANKLKELSETFDSKPSAERQKYATMAHGAQFVEVKVDPDLGTVRVTRVIEATACGKIMNPKTSHSQEIGGVIWGIGMALQEMTEIDHRYGRMMNRGLADYHIPVHADVHEIETLFVEEDDKIVNPLGVKGMGELGLVGIPAAIANAVYHATGIRVRDLPITPDKLLGRREA